MKTLLISAAALLVAACAHADHAAPQAGPEKAAHHGPHIFLTGSAYDHAETVARLKNIIDARDLKTFAVIDHAAGAASIGEGLRATTLIIFGNPRGGTPLMQSDQTIGIALPLRALVFEDEAGAVQIATPDIEHTLKEFGVSDEHPDMGEKLGGLLAVIAQEAGS